MLKEKKEVKKKERDLSLLTRGSDAKTSHSEFKENMNAKNNNEEMRKENRTKQP